MTTEAKVGWIKAIAAAGVKEIEVGSFVPPRVIPQLSDTPEVVEQCLKIPGLIVQALAPNLRGVQNAYNAGVHKISIPVSVSEGHSMANLNRKPEQSIEMMREIMAWLKAQPRRVPLVAVIYGVRLLDRRRGADGTTPSIEQPKAVETPATTGTLRGCAFTSP